MQRRKLAALLNLVDNIGVDCHALEEIFSSVRHAMSYRINLRQAVQHSVYGVCQNIENALDAFGVVGDRLLYLIVFPFIDLMGMAGIHAADALDKAFGQQSAF